MVATLCSCCFGRGRLASPTCSWSILLTRLMFFLINEYDNPASSICCPLVKYGPYTCTGDYKHMYEDIPPCKYQHTRTLVGCWSLLTGPAPGPPGRPACWGWTPSAASWRSAAASWRPAAAPRPPDSPASRVPRLLDMISTRCPIIPDQVVYLSKEYETEDNFIKFSVKNLICAIVMYALSSKAIDVATGIVALQKT